MDTTGLLTALQDCSLRPTSQAHKGEGKTQRENEGTASHCLSLVLLVQSRYLLEIDERSLADVLAHIMSWGSSPPYIYTDIFEGSPGVRGEMLSLTHVIKDSVMRCALSYTLSYIDRHAYSYREEKLSDSY